VNRLLDRADALPFTSWNQLMAFTLDALEPVPINSGERRVQIENCRLEYEQQSVW
jgi:hypothetical protein